MIAAVESCLIQSKQLMNTHVHSPRSEMNFNWRELNAMFKWTTSFSSCPATWPDLTYSLHRMLSDLTIKVANNKKTSQKSHTITQELEHLCKLFLLISTSTGLMTVNHQRTIIVYRNNRFHMISHCICKREAYVNTNGELEFISRQCHRALHGSRRSLVAEEVRRVQSRHRRVLGELNLSVEAMLMPTVVDNNDEDEPQDQRGASTEELLSSVSPTDDLLSPVGCDMDSGFSGSSSASYRLIETHCNVFVLWCGSGLGSLRRGIGKTSTPELAGGQRKTKAAMIWKKGWKGWKKLHSFGNNSNKT
ncbi:unnamed protein product, partial [Heterotrigona itama]